MTIDEFRSNPVLVGAMRALLQTVDGNPSVLAQAIVAVQNERPMFDAKDDDPEIVSVRRLSRSFQHDEVLNLLLSCGEPLPVAPQEEEPTFGVDREKFNQK